MPTTQRNWLSRLASQRLTSLSRKQWLLIVLILAGAGAASVLAMSAYHTWQDYALVSKIKPTSEAIYRSITEARDGSHQDRLRWAGRAQRIAQAHKLSLLLGEDYFTLCADFHTDASGASRLTNALPAAELPHHPAGLACYKFAVTLDQRLTRDIRSQSNLMVVGVSRPSVVESYLGTAIMVYDLGPSDFDPSFLDQGAEVLTKDGHKVTNADVKPGEVVTVYYGERAMNGGELLDKILIEDSGIYPHYCEIIQLRRGYDVAPNAACPASVTGLRLTRINATGLGAEMTSGTQITTAWVAGSIPKVVDTSGRLLALTDLSAGSMVDLVMSGEAVTEIRKH
jgi:hypothetical protein